MNSIVATVLLNTMKLVTSGALMEHIVELVGEASNLSISGEEKRRAVMEKLKQVGSDFQPIIMATAGYVINLAVEVAVAYLRSRSEQ